MPSYAFTGFSPSQISFLSGSQLRVDPHYAAASGYRFEITDDDATWSGRSASQDKPNDEYSQNLVVRNGAGTVVASGRSQLRDAYTLTDEFGNSVRIYEVQIGGTRVGYVADRQIQPGNTYAYTSSNVTLSTQPTYASLASQTYDPAPANAVQGTSNADSLAGGTGDDTLLGGAGDDSIDGGSGADLILGGGGTDFILGGAGNDTIDGGDRTDTIHGGAGDDYIHDTGGIYSDDTIFGDAGNDTIRGGVREDYMDGGDDADTFIIENAFGRDTIIGGEGGTDSDLIDFSALSNAITVTYSGNEAGSATDGADTLAFSEIERLTLTGQDDSVNAGASALAMSVNAGDGHDTVVGSSAADAIFGDGGNDEIHGGSGNDTIGGGDGDDYIDGGDGDDLLTSGLGNDTLIGGAGDDTLMNSGGNDSLVGGAGNDSIIATAGYDTLEGGDGDDTLYGGTEDDRLVGGTGADSMMGGDDADTFVIEDAFGADTILGGEGVTSTSDSDTIDGFALTTDVTVLFTGDEIGTLTDGTDTIDFSEIENVFTGSGDDLLDARSDNVGVGLFGNAGSDTIYGGFGADHIHGGADADTFFIQDGFGADTIFGGEDGVDFDVIDLSAMTTSITVTYTGNEAGWITDGTDTLHFAQIERLILTSYADMVDATADGVGVDIDAGSGDNTIIGGSGNDTLRAGSGRDSIDGGSGSDSVFAGAGRDTVVGGSGDDRIAGGAGNDELRGGTGNDTFIHTAGDGHDTITDFNLGNAGALGDGDPTNNDVIAFGSHYDNMGELRADFADDGMLNQSNATAIGGEAVDYSDNALYGAGDGLTVEGASQSSFTADNTGVICFTTGTRIATPGGEIPIERLRPGDLVLTRDNGPQPVIWIHQRCLDRQELALRPALRPILIAPDLVAADAPLLVSPQHGLLMLCDGAETLVRANHLARMKGGKARVARGCRAVTYVHLMFEAHQIVLANKAPSESFFPGSQAMNALAQPALRELATLFPDVLRDDPARAYGSTARVFSRWRHLPPHVAGLQSAPR